MSTLETTGTVDGAPEASVEMNHSSTAVREEREPASDDAVNRSSVDDSSSTSMVMQLNFEASRAKTESPSPVVENERNEEEEVQLTANSPEAVVIPETPRKVSEFVMIAANPVCGASGQEIEVEVLGNSETEEKEPVAIELMSVGVEDVMKEMESNLVDTANVGGESPMSNNVSEAQAITSTEKTPISRGNETVAIEYSNSETDASNKGSDTNTGVGPEVEEAVEFEIPPAAIDELIIDESLTSLDAATSAFLDTGSTQQDSVVEQKNSHTHSLEKEVPEVQDKVSTKKTDNSYRIVEKELNEENGNAEENMVISCASDEIQCVVVEYSNSETGAPNKNAEDEITAGTEEKAIEFDISSSEIEDIVYENSSTPSDDTEVGRSDTGGTKPESAGQQNNSHAPSSEELVRREETLISQEKECDKVTTTVAIWNGTTSGGHENEEEDQECEVRKAQMPEEEDRSGDFPLKETSQPNHTKDQEAATEQIVSDSAAPKITELKEPAITSYERTLVNDTEEPLATVSEKPAVTVSEELLVYSTEESFVSACEENVAKASDEPLATPENSQRKVCKEPLFKVPEVPFSTVIEECIVNESEEPLVATSGEPLVTTSAKPHPNVCEEAFVNASEETLETTSEENIVNMPEKPSTNVVEERHVNSSEELLVSASEEPDDNISEEPEIIDTTQVIPIDYAAEYNNYAAFKRALDKFNEEGHEFILGPSTKHTTKDFKYKRATFQCKYGPIEEEQEEDEDDDNSGMKTILYCPALLRLQFDREERVLRIISYDPLHARHGLVRAYEAENEADEINGPTSPRAAADGKLPQNPPPSPAVQTSPRPLVEGTFSHYLAFKKHHWEEVTRSRRNSRIGSTSPRKSSVSKKGTVSAMSPQRKATLVPDDDLPWSDLQGSSKQTELHWMNVSPTVKVKTPSKPGGLNIFKQKQHERIALDEDNRFWPWYREESSIDTDNPDFWFPDVNMEYFREPSSPGEDDELADGLQRSEVQSDELPTEVIAEPISDGGHFEATATFQAGELVTELADSSQSSDVQSEQLPTEVIAAPSDSLAQTSPKRGRGRPSKAGSAMPAKGNSKSDEEVVGTQPVIQQNKSVQPPDHQFKRQDGTIIALGSHDGQPGLILSASNHSGEHAKEATSEPFAQTSPKRGRGRPLKTASATQVISQREQGELIENDAKSSTHKRGRGRPKKIDSGSDGNTLATRETEASSTTYSGKKGSMYDSVRKRCRSVHSTPPQGFTSSSANMDGIKAQNVMKTQRATDTNQNLRISNSEDVPMKRGRGRPRKSESDKQPIRILRSSLTLRSPENANVEKVEKESPRTAETENQPSGTSKVKSILTSPPPKRGRGRPLGAKNKQHQFVTLSSSKEYRKLRNGKTRSLPTSRNSKKGNAATVAVKRTARNSRKSYFDGPNKGKLRVKYSLTSPSVKRGRGRLPKKKKQNLKLATTSQAPNTRRGRPITTDSTQLNDGIRKQKCTNRRATTPAGPQRGRGRARDGVSVPITKGTTAESLKESNGQEPPPLKRGRNNSSKRDSEQPAEELRGPPVNRHRVRPPTRSCTMTAEYSSPVMRYTQVSLPLKRTRSMPPNETSNSLSGDSRSESCSKRSPSAKIGRCKPPTRSSTNFMLRRSRKTAPTLTVTLRKRRTTPSIASTGPTKKRKESKMI